MNLRWYLNKKAKDLCAMLFRKSICMDMRSRLRNRDVSIISSNCIGGILSHDLGIQFASPTVNLFFTAGDFVKFVSDLRRYTAMTPELDEEQTKEKGYPVALLDDIRVYAVHYHDLEQLRKAWKRRSDRIHWDNLFLVMTDRNGLTEDDLLVFSKLPWPKVLFSAKEHPGYDFVVHVKECIDGKQVGQLQFFADFQGQKKKKKSFDFVGWLNNETV